MKTKDGINLGLGLEWMDGVSVLLASGFFFLLTRFEGRWDT